MTAKMWLHGIPPAVQEKYGIGEDVEVTVVAAVSEINPRAHGGNYVFENHGETHIWNAEQLRTWGVSYGSV